MADEAAAAGTGRHSILDLAPLELDCLNALWPIGEATVRQIQEAMRPTRPRAYTTIMTILDRLAQKGIVQRRKAGRAWVYRASVSAEQARTHAVAQVVLSFFGGSADALAEHLSEHGTSMQESVPSRLVIVERREAAPPIARARRASADGGATAPPVADTGEGDRFDTALL